MLSDKGTNIFSEIGKFFKENDATSAIDKDSRTAKRIEEYNQSRAYRQDILACCATSPRRLQ